MKKILLKISKICDKLSNFIIKRVDCWYVKSNLPKMVKEFIFLFAVLTGSLIGDVSDIIARYVNKI